MKAKVFGTEKGGVLKTAGKDAVDSQKKAKSTSASVVVEKKEEEKKKLERVPLGTVVDTDNMQRILPLIGQCAYLSDYIAVLEERKAAIVKEIKAAIPTYGLYEMRVGETFYDVDWTKVEKDVVSVALVRKNGSPDFVKSVTEHKEVPTLTIVDRQRRTLKERYKAASTTDTPSDKEGDSTKKPVEKPTVEQKVSVGKTDPLPISTDKSVQTSAKKSVEKQIESLEKTGKTSFQKKKEDSTSKIPVKPSTKKRER